MKFPFAAPDTGIFDGMELRKMRMRRMIAFLVAAVLVAAGAAAQSEGQKKQAPPNEVKMPFT